MSDSTASVVWQTPALVPLISARDAAGKVNFSFSETPTIGGRSYGPS